MTGSYSLIDEPWINVTTAGGQPTSVSLKQIFDGSIEIEDIRGDSPTQDYAVLRTILAVFWRAHQPDSIVRPGETFHISEWIEDVLDDARNNSPDEKVLEYLERYRDRFDLLDDEHPFMQVAGLSSGKDDVAPINRIVPEAQDNYFTMRVGEPRESISLAEAARWTIHVQAYDYSGIKTGMLGDDRVKGGRGYPIGTGWSGMTGGTVILGPTLRETFVLNTTVDALNRRGDKPVWERTPDTAASRDIKIPPDPSTPVGPSDFATWQSRRVRLFADGDRATGVLVGNGDRIADAGANSFGDPMTPYRFSANKSKKGLDVYYPVPYSNERTMWRSLEPLLVLEGDLHLEQKKKPPIRPFNISTIARLRADDLLEVSSISIRLVSMSYGPQSSSVGTMLMRELELPIDLLVEGHRRERRVVLDAASVTNAASVCLGSFAGQLQQAAGGEYAFSATTTDQILGTMEPKFREWLGGLVIDSIDDAARQWQQVVNSDVLEYAESLIKGAGPRALIGREKTSGDARTRHISAGTAHIWLKRKLKETLPLAYGAVEEGTVHVTERKTDE